MATVKVNINGMDVQAEEGMTIYEVAQSLGIYIPTLCYHPDLSTFGGCRVCMVEANGEEVTACRAPIKDGMVIKTDTENVSQMRLINVELILTNHDQDCQSCARNNNCKLQEVSAFVGVTPERMQRLRRVITNEVKDISNPIFQRDFAKCIVCGICVRTCEEINGIAAIDFGFRGYKTTISTLGDKPILESKCESCGECVERCPTGALVVKGQVIPEREVKTVCAYCGVGCGLILGVRGSRVVSVRGDRENPVNNGHLCIKGRYGFDFLNHPERLKTPLVRKGGVLTEASWEEALSLVAAKIKEYRDNFGPDALAALASARCTNEDNYLLQKLFRSLGTNNIDHCARL